MTVKMFAGRAAVCRGDKGKQRSNQDVGGIVALSLDVLREGLQNSLWVVKSWRNLMKSFCFISSIHNLMEVHDLHVIG